MPPDKVVAVLVFLPNKNCIVIINGTYDGVSLNTSQWYIKFRPYRRFGEVNFVDVKKVFGEEIALIERDWEKLDTFKIKPESSIGNESIGADF
jgi:hypothetical protein